MTDKEQMVQAAKSAMTYVMDVNEKDAVLVVTDEARKSIGEAFAEAAKQLGCTVDFYLLPEDQRPLSEVPQEMKQMLEGKTVVINAFTGKAEETPFRIKWIKSVLATGRIRLGHAPGITEDMMLHGPMNIDYPMMMNLVDRMLKALEGAKTAHITSPGGTDLHLNIEDRPFETDVHITTEHFGNLPAGEIWCAPVETDAHGVLVCDGSIGDLGMVTSPVRMTIRNGKIESIECEDKELLKKLNEVLYVDEEAHVIGEFGIGLNPGARITGNLLEDEKAFRTIHIAFGNNEEMAGGQNRSQTHRDFLVKDPTVTITYKDGRQETLIRDGEIQVS